MVWPNFIQITRHLISLGWSKAQHLQHSHTMSHRHPFRSGSSKRFTTTKGTKFSPTTARHVWDPLQSSRPQHGGATATSCRKKLEPYQCMTCGPIRCVRCTRRGCGRRFRCSGEVALSPSGPLYSTSPSHPAQPGPKLTIPFRALYYVH
jgi:hypothetical protein